MGGLSPEQRKEFGMAANKTRADIEQIVWKKHYPS